MQERLKQILKDLDLNDKEIKAYLSVLVLGDASINDVSKQTKIERTSCYKYLDKLAKLGLITFDFKKYGKKVSSLPLKKLINVFENKQRKLRRHSLEIQDLLPQLEKDFNLQNKRMPKIQYFEGIEGAKKIYQDTLENNSKKIIRNYSSADDCLNFIPELLDWYIKKRIKNKVEVKLLTSQPTSKTGERMNKTVAQEFRKYKVLPDKFLLSSEYLIYDNKIASISLNSDHEKIWGMIIEDKELAKNQKNIFDLLWKLL